MIRTLTTLAIAAAAVAAPAFAASDEFKMEIDLNRAQLETVEGAQAEYDRISGEVSEQCAAKQPAFNLGQKRYAAALCERQTMKKVVAYVADENFTAVHQASK